MASGRNSIKYSRTTMKRALELLSDAEDSLRDFGTAIANLKANETNSINGMSEFNLDSYKVEEEEKEDGFSLDSLGNKIKNYITVISYVALCGFTKYSSPYLAKEAQKSFNRGKINSYSDILDDLCNKGEESYAIVHSDLEKLSTAFKAIQNKVELFEHGDIGLYDELLENGEKNDYTEGFSKRNSEYNGVDDVETITYAFDENEPSFLENLSQIINIRDVSAVLFTDLNFMMSGRVASEIYCLENNITGSDKQNFVIRAVNQAHETTQVAIGNGYFDYTTPSAMAEVYREKLGIDVSEEDVAAQIESDYKSVIEKETGMSYDEFEDMVSNISGIYGTGSLVSGGMMTAAGFAAAGTMSFDTHFTDEEKEAINEVKEAAGVEIEEINDIKVEPKSSSEVIVESQPNSNVEMDKIIDSDMDTEIEPEVLGESIIQESEVIEQTETSGIEEGPVITENVPNTPRITPEVAQEIANKIQHAENNQPPAQLESPKPSSSEIDKQVRDDYYSSSQLAEDRVKAIESYDSMPDEEKITNLEKFGYTTVVAAGLVADRAAGQTAFILGLEEQHLASMSNTLAAQQGLTNHATSFGSVHSMDYFSSGQANIDLTPTTKAVQDARINMDQAKENYNSSVSNANESISKANSSKDKYNNTLNSIKNRSGDDPKDWSEEDVEEYNKAAKDYNAAVDEANRAVKEAEESRSIYEKGKEEYSVAYEEYRKQAEEALRTIRENDGGNVDIIEEVTNTSDVPNIVEPGNDDGKIIIEPTTNPIENTSTEELIPTTDGIVYED